MFSDRLNEQTTLQDVSTEVVTFGDIEECVEVVSDATGQTVESGAAAEESAFIPNEAGFDAEPPEIIIDAHPSVLLTAKNSASTAATHNNVGKSPQKTPEMAAEVSVRSSDVTTQSGGASPAASSSTDDDSSQMSGGYNESDAEIVMLLTLLQKGPNYNPACPTEKTTTTASQLAKQRLEGLANAVRKRVAGGEGKKDESAPQEKGISSSLLAVIEQLRERTTSTSGENVEEHPGASVQHAFLKPNHDCYKTVDWFTFCVLRF